MLLESHLPESLCMLKLAMSVCTGTYGHSEAKPHYISISHRVQESRLSVVSHTEHTASRTSDCVPQTDRHTVHPTTNMSGITISHTDNFIRG